jgi:hypothetical protein
MNTRHPILRQHVLPVCIGLGLSLGLGVAQASQLSKGQLKDVQAQAEARHDQAMEGCKALSGNAADICEAEANWKETRTVATAKAMHEGTPQAAFDARKAIAKAELKMADEKCDDLNGNPADVCRKQAEASYTVAMADAKARLKAKEAMAEAAQEKADANYDAAKAQCDALSGDAKDACVERAKQANGQ